MSWPLASFLILALALAAGFAWYERSHPSSRTVAMVASLAALATLGRVAFAPLPSVKPTTDIVLISGYVLGGPPGFAVGAVAALASNIVFGQGPWTPWQMLAWGMVGLLGAGLRRRRAGPIPRLAMALICAAAGFAYGLVLNFSTFVTFAGAHTLAQFLVIEGAAFTFDLAHAAGNFAFFLLFGPALVRALQRFRLRMDVQWGPAAPAALALALALVCVAAGAARSPGTALAQSASAVPPRSVAYLERAQNADGGFGLAPGEPSTQLASAWAAIGLAAAGEDPAALARGGHTVVAWIRSRLHQLQGAGDIERTILAVAAARAPLGTLVGQLARRRRADGSVGEQSNLTSFAILAMRAAGAGGSRATLAWLERQQNVDGGFSFAVRGDPSDLDDTAAAIEALSGGAAPAALLARAHAYLAAGENADGGFPQQPGGESNAQSTAWAAQALAALHAPTQRPLAYLRARLQPSGAVAYSAGVTITPVWVTAEALAAFAGAPLPLATAARGARPGGAT